ncbi:MAG: polysaccharide deacetylase family protein [Bacteroidetes bacterium]|nr:polysaccharide deacetylase family protein [Bacteroidota bacterium]
MIRYPVLHIIFLCGLAVCILVAFRNQVFWYVGVAWLLVFLVIMVTGSARICSGMYVKAICRSHVDEKVVSLTFDDGPYPVYTEAVLDILKSKEIRATFFIKGRNAALYPDLIRRMHDEGHIIGNHSWSHDHLFDLFPAKRMNREIRETNRIVREITGKSPVLFRPPYGVTNPAVARALKNENHMVIGWNIRSYDTILNDPIKIAQRIKKRLKPGSIILLHDNRKRSEKILKEVINIVKENGYKFARIDELLNILPYAAI